MLLHATSSSRKLIKALMLAAVLVGTVGASSTGAENWIPLDNPVPPSKAANRYTQPGQAVYYAIDPVGLADLLLKAPITQTGRVRDCAPKTISLPAPNGKMQRFLFAESPILQDKIALKYPEIKTYAAQGIDDPYAVVRFSWTPLGLNASILSPTGNWVIEPSYLGDNIVHQSYYQRDFSPSASRFQCLTLGSDAAKAKHSTETRNALTNGARVRSLRMAIGTTTEYTRFAGGSVASALAEICIAVNYLNNLYVNELATFFVLVGDPEELINLAEDADTDPYTNAIGGTLLAEAIEEITSVVVQTEREDFDLYYDIGHVFAGPQTGGGVALIGSVCTPSRAGGTSSGFDANGPRGLFFNQIFAHEVGHQVGANHTFNSSQGNCGGNNRNASTAYEPGAGSTIMSYAGNICGTDRLQNLSDEMFHSVSLDEISSTINNRVATGQQRGIFLCGTDVTSNINSIPTIAVPSTRYSIPRSTPFKLNVTGSDDADAADDVRLTYSWEQRDLGPSRRITDPDNGSSPLFRVFPPTTNSFRYFPRLEDVLNNTTTVGEKIPTEGQLLNFRVVVRDNASSRSINASLPLFDCGNPAQTIIGGAFAMADLSVGVPDNTGPFRITYPNSSVVLSPSVSTVAKTTHRVTWDVAGTNLTPINTSEVQVFLSLDGGLSFNESSPLEILVSESPSEFAFIAPNTGFADVVIPPGIRTDKARIKIQPVNNIYYAVTRSNFTIEEIKQPVIAVNRIIQSNSVRLTSTGQRGEPLASQSFTIQNRGNGTLRFTTRIVYAPISGVVQNWLTVTPRNDTSKGEAIQTDVTFNSTGLPPATYTANISISDPAASNSPFSVPVTMTIEPGQPTISVNPPSLSRIVVTGSAGQAQTLSVQNSALGNAPMSFRVSADVPWIVLNPASGRTEPGIPDTITVAYATADLADGNYTGSLTFRSENATNNNLVVPVGITVIATPKLTLTRPLGNETAIRGQPFEIKWDSTQQVSTKIRIDLLKGLRFVRTIEPEIENNGSYVWTVPSDLRTAVDYRVRISAPFTLPGSTTTAGTTTSQTPGQFRITVAPLPGTLLSPSSGAEFRAGKPVPIRWRLDSAQWGRSVSIRLVNSDGDEVSLVSAKTANDGNYSWTAPRTISGTDYQLVISSISNPDLELIGPIAGFDILAAAPKKK